MSEPPSDPPDATPDPLSALVAPVAATRYDAALAVILVSFVTAPILELATGLGATGALAVPAVVSLLVIVDICYLRPPLEGSED